MHPALSLVMNPPVQSWKSKAAKDHSTPIITGRQTLVVSRIAIRNSIGPGHDAGSRREAMRSGCTRDGRLIRPVCGAAALSDECAQRYSNRRDAVFFGLAPQGAAGCDRIGGSTHAPRR